MQGQKSATGSLPDSINFDYGSTSSNMGLDQQICCNTLRDPAESMVISQEAHNWSRWNICEPGSSSHQNLLNHSETMTPNGWTSSMGASVGAGEVNDTASVNSRNGVNLNLNSNASFFRTSNSGSTSQSHDINVGQLGQVGDLMEYSQSHPSKSSGLEHRLIPSRSGSSESFASSSGTGGFLADEDDNRLGYSMDGRRLSCKRKTIEGSAGQQPSSSGTYLSREGSTSLVSAQLDTSLGVSTPNPEHHRLRRSMGGVAPLDSVNLPTFGIGSGSSRRNYRMATNSTAIQDSLSNNLVLPRVSVGQSDVPVGHNQPLRFVPLIPSQGSTPPSIHPENATLATGSRRSNNIQRVRWSAGSSSRPRNSSVEMDPPSHEDLNSRPPPPPMPRNISEHPMFIMPSTHNNATDLNVNGGSAATSRHVGSISSSRSTVGAAWGTQHHSSSQYSRRLPEYVRRSLLSSAGSSEGSGSTSAQHLASSSQEAVLPVPSAVGGAQVHNPSSSQHSRRMSEYVRRSLLSSSGSSEGSGSTSAQRSAASSQEVVLPIPSPGGAQVHDPLFSRSAALWMDRRGGDGDGVPYSLRALAAAGGEGRFRRVSEQIRNALDIMRRGEELQFEDVMILDPSVLFGMAGIHDQQRDMRLDIDNMSYEELLALEERIGNVSTGLTEEKIMAHLKRRKYLSVRRFDQTETEPCCVCQEEYNDGEDLGVLDCGHEFHAGCIKQWLAQKNSCPICKTTGLAT